jgi:hypothetical protein
MHTCKATVTVLVLVTPEAIQSLGFPPNSIDNALYLPFGLQSLNFALFNSGIFGKTFNFIVEPYEFDFSGLPLIDVDLTAFGTDPNALALREANEADLMVLLTDERYQNVLGAWAATFSGPAVYGIVNIEHLFGLRNVFAHELGHAFSLQHTRDEMGGITTHETCQFAWHLVGQEGLEYETVVATLSNQEIDAGVRQILNFSNPDVEYSGVPTGTMYDANAFKLSERMCIVADIRENDELEVSITGPDEICDQLANFSAEILVEPAAGSPGSAPYSYAWSMSTTGFFNSAPGSNNPPPIILGYGPNLQIFVNQTFWLSLAVCGSEGVCVNHVIRVSNCGGAPPQKPSVDTKTAASYPATIEVYPNPANDYLQIDTKGSLAEFIYFDIQNCFGQLIHSGVLDHELTIPLEKNTFPNGYYFLRLRDNLNLIKTLPFSITR